MKKPRLEEVTRLEPEARAGSERSYFCRSNIYNLQKPFLNHNLGYYGLKDIVCIISPCCHNFQPTLKSLLLLFCPGLQSGKLSSVVDLEVHYTKELSVICLYGDFRKNSLPRSSGEPTLSPRASVINTNPH